MLAATAWGGPLDSLLPKAPSVVMAPPAPITLGLGKAAKVDLAFRVEAGYHINSNTPRSDLLLPTILRLQPPAELTVVKVNYPAGQDVTFAFLPGEKLNVYAGDFAVTATVKAAPSVAPGAYRVPGTLRYQACDQRQCFAPKEIPISFEVNVARAAQR
jgi:hypothetical protein